MTHFARTLSLSLSLAVASTVAAASPAHADAVDSTRTTLQLAAGVEMLGGAATSAGFRGRALVGTALGDGAVRPELAFGATFGAGTLSVADMRALDGRLSLSLRTMGPEARVGLRFVDGGFVDNRVYASFALLKVDLDRRLAFDAVPGVSDASTRGLRAAIGGSWADSWGKKLGSCCSGRDDSLVLLFLLLAPQQAELSWERDAGSDRFGVMFGYGI
jgi:hypothetical protein